MIQYYLINNHLSHKPSGVLLAKGFINSEAHSYPMLVEPLLRIKTIIKNLSLNDDGEIDGLTERRTKNGQIYLCISDEYNYLPTGRRISYEILKKLNSFDHVYEVRFMAGDNKRVLQCRVILTVEKHTPFLIWTHGFSKSKSNTFYYGCRDANELTNKLAEVAHDIFSDVDVNYTSDNYVGKEGERIEV